MSRSVLDASAALAVINLEPGCETVVTALPTAIISTVNAAEVITKLVEQGGSFDQAARQLGQLMVETVVFDDQLALDTAALRPLTRDRGLSLGDRACLALALRENAPVLTADQAWKGLDVGVEVVLIR